MGGRTAKGMENDPFAMGPAVDCPHELGMQFFGWSVDATVCQPGKGTYYLWRGI